MKIIIAILLLTGVYLFYPIYDLASKDDIFTNDFHVVGRDYLSLGNCIDAATAESAIVFSCIKKNHWDEISTGFTQYNPEIREIRKELAGKIDWQYMR